MSIRMYKSYGVLAHEKVAVYSVRVPASDAYEVVNVTLPDDVEAYETVSGDTVVVLDGTPYTVQEAVQGTKNGPVLRWYNGQWHTRKLTEAFDAQ